MNEQHVYHSQAKGFFESLVQRLPYVKVAEKVEGQYAAPDFSVVADYIQPNELRLSAMMRDLLDPNGKHGQQLVFFDHFINQLRRSDGYHGQPCHIADIQSNITIRTEVPTRHNRRIDLLIESSEMLIAIENKPWTIDQLDQVQDYIEHVQSDPKGRLWLFVYMPGYVCYPTSYIRPAETDSNILTLPYRAQEGQPSVAEWLKTSLDEIKAPNVRQFVTELHTYIEKEFTVLRI